MRLWQLGLSVRCSPSCICILEISAQPYSCMPSRIVYWSHSITREQRNMQTVSCCATSERAIPVEIALHCHFVIRHVQHSSQVCKPAWNFEVSSFDPPFLSGLFPQAISGAKLTLYKETTEKVLMVTGNQRQCTVSLDGYQLLQIGKFFAVKMFCRHFICDLALALFPGFMWGRRGKYGTQFAHACLVPHAQTVGTRLSYLLLPELEWLDFQEPQI